MANQEICNQKRIEMKKLLKYYFLLSSCLLMLLSCSRAQDQEPEKTTLLEDKKVLILYLSRTKNTKAVAGLIHQQVGGDLVALELVTPYQENYQQIVAQVSKENESGFLPPLKTRIDSLQKYDVVFLGFPTWGMQLPPPMKSFLKQHNLSGKTIVPFNTNAGYGIGSTFDTVKQLCPDSKILEGFTTKGGIERDGVLFVMEDKRVKQVELEVKNWLMKIGLIK
jgi:flavodoxin